MMAECLLAVTTAWLWQPLHGKCNIDCLQRLARSIGFDPNMSILHTKPSDERSLQMLHEDLLMLTTEADLLQLGSPSLARPESCSLGSRRAV